MKPSESLAKTLEKARGSGGKPLRRPNYRNTDDPELDTSHSAGNSTFYGTRTEEDDVDSDYVNDNCDDSVNTETNGMSRLEIIIII